MSSAGSGGAGVGGGGGASSTPCDPAMAMCPCVLQGECAIGTVCLSGTCIAPCNFDYQCPAGKLCANGACTPGCLAGSTCADPGYKCSKGVCVPDNQNPQCSATSPCPKAEQVCLGGVCAAPCSSNAQCPSGQVCDWAAGACVNDPSVKTVCSSDAQCVGASPQQCGDNANEDGFCHFICNPMGQNGGVTQCKLIDSRFDYCDQGVCKTTAEVDPQCTTQNPCPLGMDCISNKCL